MQIPEPPQIHFPSPYERPHTPLSFAQRIERPDGAFIATFGYNTESTAQTPILFLHGNGEDHEIFGPIIDACVEVGYPVYALDSRAQGQSTRGTAKLTYEVMANDAIGVMEALDLKRCHLVGFSDGAIEALLIVSKHPELVASLTSIGANLTPEGVNNEGWDPQATIQRLLDWAEWVENLPKDGAIDPTLMSPTAQEARQQAELLNLMEIEPHIDPESLKSISCPTTVMAGQYDVIKPEETKRIVRAISQAQLFISEGHGHTLPKEAPDDVIEVVLKTVKRML